MRDLEDERRIAYVGMARARVRLGPQVRYGDIVRPRPGPGSSLRILTWAKLVLSEGAHHVLDHTAPGYVDECVRLTGGQGPAIIMEMLANVNLQKDLGIIGMHGRIVVIGNRGTVEINARFAMNNNANILGMALTHARPFELAGIHAALVEGLRNASLRPVIAQELPLSQAARSHEAVLEPGHHGKVILVP